MKNRTYRFFEGTPLYPFGYGLTYGKCAVTSMDVETVTLDGEFDGARVTVKVKNEGSAATEDVVQIYIKDEGYELAIPNPCLCGYERVSLESGEEKTVVIVLDRRAFTSVDEEGNRELFSKKFKVYAGTSQPDKRSESLTGVACLEKEIEI